MNNDQKAYNAGRLIQWGLQPNIHAGSESEYSILVEQYLSDLDFKSAVTNFAQGLGLKILAVDQKGLVLSPIEGSVFEWHASIYRQSTSADERLLIGLIHIAILATIFPRKQDLEYNPSYLTREISPSEVEETMRNICEHLSIQSQGKPDPTLDERSSGLEGAWRAYNRLSGKRVSIPTMIEKELDFLKQKGCFILRRRDGSIVYQPTWRYHILAQEAAPRLYNLINTPSPNSGV